MNQLQFMSRTAPKQAREEPVLDREIHTTATYPTRGPKGSLSLQADSLAARAAGGRLAGLACAQARKAPMLAEPCLTNDRELPWPRRLLAK